MTTGATPVLTDDTIGALLDCVDPAVDPAERDRLADQLRRSPDTARALDRQVLVRGAVLEAAPPAPAGLRARVASPRRPPAFRPRRLAIAGAGAALAAAAAAVVVALTGAERTTVEQVARLDGPQRVGLTDPRPGSVRPTALDVRGAGLTFPNLAPRFGWRAIEQGRSTIAGRETTSVVYAKGDRRVTYSILPEADATEPPSGRKLTRAGIRFAAFEQGPRTAITWTRSGRTCILSGARMSDRELVRLASWRPQPRS